MQKLMLADPSGRLRQTAIEPTAGVGDGAAGAATAAGAARVPSDRVNAIAASVVAILLDIVKVLD
ncbi:hypothetical protein ACFVW2_40645 [Streptomyces sp. NPDC058171]